MSRTRGSVVTSGDSAGAGLVQMQGPMMPRYLQTRARVCTCTLRSWLRIVIARVFQGGLTATVNVRLWRLVTNGRCPASALCGALTPLPGHTL